MKRQIQRQVAATGAGPTPAGGATSTRSASRA